MSAVTNTPAICLMISSLAIAGQAAAQQQDAESVRSKCIEQASKSFPGTAMEGPESRARVEMYISCMRQHGLNP
jgi:hypothetical protein